MADRTFLELQEEVLAHGFDPNVYRARVKVWLNEGLARVVRRTKLAMRDLTVPIPLVSGTQDYPLPADLVSIRELRTAATGSVLRAVDVLEIDAMTPGPGAPELYATAGQLLRLYPIPNAAASLELRYRADSAAMAADTDLPGIPDDYAHVLVSYAASRAFRAEDDYEAATFFWSEYQRDLGEMRSSIAERDSSRVRQVQGLIGTDYTPGGFRRP